MNTIRPSEVTEAAASSVVPNVARCGVPLTRQLSRGDRQPARCSRSHPRAMKEDAVPAPPRRQGTAALETPGTLLASKTLRACGERAIRPAPSPHTNRRCSRVARRARAVPRTAGIVHRATTRAPAPDRSRHATGVRRSTGGGSHVEPAAAVFRNPIRDPVSVRRKAWRKTSRGEKPLFAAQRRDDDRCHRRAGWIEMRSGFRPRRTTARHRLRRVASAGQAGPSGICWTQISRFPSPLRSEAYARIFPSSEIAG